MSTAYDVITCSTLPIAYNVQYIIISVTADRGCCSFPFFLLSLPAAARVGVDR